MAAISPLSISAPTVGVDGGVIVAGFDFSGLLLALLGLDLVPTPTLAFFFSVLGAMAHKLYLATAAGQLDEKSLGSLTFH